MGLEIDGVNLGFEEGNGGGVLWVWVCYVDSEVELRIVKYRLLVDRFHASCSNCGETTGTTPLGLWIWNQGAVVGDSGWEPAVCWWVIGFFFFFFFFQI